MLGLALTKYSGKFGVLNYAVEGMMSRLAIPPVCRYAVLACRYRRANYDMGDMWCNDPESMVKAKYIIIWGANPARCSMHSMRKAASIERAKGRRSSLSTRYSRLRQARSLPARAAASGTLA